jgi:uncharacterized protein (DUF1499 family)
MNRKKIKVLIFGILVTYAVIFGVNSMSKTPEGLGVKNGLLSTCPSSPNCVSSQASPEDKEHFIEALSYTTSEIALMAKIDELIEEWPRAQILTQSEDYYHLVMTTLLFRFKDDFEIYVDRKNKQVHFRSASRVGYSDFGTNRKRVTRFKERLLLLLKS